jgi:ATP-binding cassette subfamily C protein LapB
LSDKPIAFTINAGRRPSKPASEAKPIDLKQEPPAEAADPVLKERARSSEARRANDASSDPAEPAQAVENTAVKADVEAQDLPFLSRSAPSEAAQAPTSGTVAEFPAPEAPSRINRGPAEQISSAAPSSAPQIADVTPRIELTDGPEPQHAAVAPAFTAHRVFETSKNPGRSAEDRVANRADLIVAYAGYLGSEAAAADAYEAMRGHKPGDVSPSTLLVGLQATGLKAEIATVAQVMPDLWPALAIMKSGQAVLILSQDRNTLSVYDPSVAGHRMDVPLADFEPVFTGVLLRGKASMKQLAQTHMPDKVSRHWFWGEFPRFRRQIAEIALGSLVANLLAVAVALFSLQVYDRVIPHQSVATLWVLAIGAFLAIALEAGLKLARSRLMDGAGRVIEMQVQSLLMGRILGMRSDKKITSPSGLFSAMREFGSVREFFTSSTIGTITDVPFIAVFLLLVWSIAGNIVWVLIVGGILMVAPGYFFQRKMIELTKQTQGASVKASRLLHEAIFELDTLKTQRGEDRVRRLWDELNSLSATKSSEQRRLAALLTYWSQGLQQATYIIAVMAGTFLVFKGEFTVGTIIAVGLLTSRTLAPLTQLAGTMARWSNVRAALDGLDAIAEAEQEYAGGRSYLRRDKLNGNFDLHAMEYRYDTEGGLVLDVPALVIKEGQKVAVLGSNGSGKSTLLKVLSGLYAPSGGRLMLDGVEMGQIDPKDIRRNLGYLSQDVRLFSGTLRENLNLNGLERDDDRMLEALDFAGLGPFVRGHHKGLDLEIRDGGEGLSIGQRQSIGWARIWLQDPRIVLLDEPTAALDQTLESTLVSRLEGWLEHRTAVIATHRVPILKLTDRTVILQNGRLAVDGPRDQVLEHLSKAKAEREAG